MILTVQPQRALWHHRFALSGTPEQNGRIAHAAALLVEQHDDAGFFTLPTDAVSRGVCGIYNALELTDEDRT